jgi:hypothetical protein
MTNGYEPVGIHEDLCTKMFYGLSKLEYFAAINMAALMSNPEIINHVNFDLDSAADAALSGANKLIEKINK